MTVYPQSYLTPKSQPWGRAVDKRLHDVEDKVRVNELNTKNNLKQLNSSVDLLGRQQDYLASFTSYVTSAPVTVVGTTMNSTTRLRQVDLSFNLSRNSKVIIEAATDYNQQINSTSWVTLSQLAAYFYIDSPSNLYGTMFNLYVNTSGVSPMNTGNGGRAILSRIVDLSAGSHSITAYWDYTQYGNIGTMGSSKVLLSATVVG
jgi:hypothetical protein